MEWPLNEFKNARRRAVIFTFVVLLTPTYFFHSYVMESSHGDRTWLIISISTIHIVISILYAFPNIFVKRIGLLSSILGDDIVNGKGFNTLFQKIYFVAFQAVGAATVGEISRICIIEIMHRTPPEIRIIPLFKGGMYALITSSLIAGFLWIGITRSREKVIIRKHWRSE
ncbi:MAG TPA: hypothetical protein EYQ58_05755 [Candidatus Poseidoniales archaeon]|nr:hypothetical protein [Candidatus Poseidoniales archaeon]